MWHYRRHFILRQLQEKYLAKKKNLYFAFVYWRKLLIECLRDVVWWTLSKLVVELWLVKIAQSMYRNARSHTRVNGTFHDDFLIHVGLHKGSELNPLFSIIVLEGLSREIWSR